jgi:gliding motility-associated-like protein
MVLDTIKNNIILSPAEEICYGMLFANLTATVPAALTGGDNIYIYKWESNINSAGWGTATGISNLPGYNPLELPQRIPSNEYYFRRVVYSGIHDVCVNTSPPVLLKDWPVIGNNTILDNQTICSGSAPALLSGTLPVNGNGSYAYLWQRKTKTLSWGSAPGTNNLQNYTPPALTDTTWFRRVATSSFCSDTSNIIVVNVHKAITNNNILLLSAVKWDTTICRGATPRILKGTIATGGTDIPGDYAFEWESSANKLSGYAAISGANGKDYQPGALTSTTYYKRKVTSGFCSSESDSVITIIVLPLISNNIISANQTICYNTAPAQLTGPVLTGGAGGTPAWLWQESPDGSSWSTATGGTSNQQNYSPPALTVPMKYRRIIFSGPVNCCIDTSNVITIGINPLPTGTITSVSDTTVCGGLQVPVKIHLTGASKWKVIYTENGSQITINKIMAQDTTLSIIKTPVAGLEIFNYALFSVQDNNGCVATSLTGTRKINVYKFPKSVPGPDAAICGPKYSLAAAPSVGVGAWYKVAGPGSATFTPNINTSNAVVAVDSVGAIWTPENIYTFRWKEINWQCKDSASVIIKFYKRIGSVNAGPDKDLYSFDKVDTLRALTPLVGTGIWSVILGAGTISNDSIVNNLSGGENKFEWTVSNGACVSKDQVIIMVNDLKIPEGFSPNNDMFNDEFVVQGLDVSYSEVSLRIVNSAGTEVFFTSNADGNTFTSWNGENENGILPEGTYYYLLTIKSLRNGTVYKKSGFIILKRYNTQ